MNTSTRCEWCDRPDCDEHRCSHCGDPCEYPCACGGCEWCCAYAVDHCPIRDRFDDLLHTENGKLH